MRQQILIFLIASVLSAAEPVVVQEAQRLSVTLDGAVQLDFGLRDGRFLGLERAAVDGTALTRPGSVQVPVVAEEYGEKPWVSSGWRFESAKSVAGGGIAVTLTLLASSTESARRQVFVHVGDEARALAEGMTPELTALQAAATAAESAILSAVDGLPEQAAVLAERAAKAAETPANDQARKAQADALKKLDQRIAQGRGPAAQAKAIAADPTLAKRDAERQTWRAALAKRSMDFARIHRDYYEFAHLLQPAHFCRPAALDALAQESSVPAGTLVWTFMPESRTIAGWTWRGWSQRMQLRLQDGRSVTAVRQLATWALGGELPGSTVINFRYRGLGRIEETFSAAGAGVKECFSTTEIIPGVVDGIPVISPAVPASVDILDRGYGLKHRVGAWICRPARGAGVSALDFQYRSDAAHASFYPVAGNLRTLIEVFPGDDVLSQTDEELFPKTSELTTTSQVHLVLNGSRSVQQWRTRWAELDRYVRDLHATDLGMVQFEARPAVGANIDSGWKGNVATLAGRMDEFAALGVKQVLVHHPGWQNGRQREPGGPDLGRAGGGDCAIWDWKPLSDTAEPWKNLQRKAAEHGIGYYVWITGMSVKDAPFFNEVGKDLRHWAINAPGKTISSGYPPNLFNHNIFDADFRRVFTQRLTDLRRDFGYQGFWADSFQNLFMSTLDWANGTGAPMQRAWWEHIAGWSRDGLGWVSESHSMPGLSCSIEVKESEDAWWFFGDTVRWYRTDMPQPGTADSDRRAFRIMANRGWLAPQISYGNQVEKAIPSFGRLAREYEAALPTMRRKYLLEGEGGVLWLSFNGDGEGVWFSFAGQAVPAGVKAVGIIDGKAADQAQAHATYRVSAADLLQSFGIPRGPQPDERIGRAWTQPIHTWPEWAQKP